MKRFLCIIIFLFIAGLSFADEYSIKRFSWDAPYKEVMSYYISNGWSMRLEDNFVHFDAPTKNDYFYINRLLKVTSVFFSFDSDGNLTSQNICCDNEYNLTGAFMAMLSASIEDGCVYYDQDYTKADNGVYNIYYYARLSDCNINYAIVGKDELYMLFICYNSML